MQEVVAEGPEGREASRLSGAPAAWVGSLQI